MKSFKHVFPNLLKIGKFVKIYPVLHLFFISVNWHLPTKISFHWKSHSYKTETILHLHGPPSDIEHIYTSPYDNAATYYITIWHAMTT